MNEISFVIAPDEFGIGDCDALEPIIDGESLIDILKRVDGEIKHSGITSIDETLRELRESAEKCQKARIQVLGCSCGVDECSGVILILTVDADTVTWSDLRATAGPPERQDYRSVGPFTFSRTQYATALASPARADAPMREQPDVAGLRAGHPNDHDGWLRAMTMAFGRDFMWMAEEVAATGLRAFEDAGNPMTEAAIRRWLRDRRFTEDAQDQYVARWRTLR